MGTRAVVVVQEDKADLVSIYRQFDGYPEGLGKEIKSILDDGQAKVINGIMAGHGNPEYFNGMGCLAAYLIAQLKTKSGIGGTYIVRPDEGPEAYTYKIYLADGSLHLKVESYGKDLYDGRLSEFDAENCR